jgi:predicted nucleotidyltransferase component of viral defense system
MTLLPRPATADGLFLWVMHRFAEQFEHHAILKGGMALRLVDSPRSTTDIDYVFVPYASRKDVRARIEAVLAEIDGARIAVALHSRMMRIELRVDDAAIQIEVNVLPDCPSTPMATGGFARAQGQPSRIVRIMTLDCALAHKIAAWNERRLMRDLFDCYFLVARLGTQPDLAILDARLARIESRHPALRRRTTMTRSELAAELEVAARDLTQPALESELGPVLPPEELAGLSHRLRAAMTRLAETLA